MSHGIEESYARLASLLEHRDAFPAGAPMADWAYRGIVRAQILLCDLDSLREVHRRIGRDPLIECVLSIRASDLREIAGVLDPHTVFPKGTPSEAVAGHVADLAAGKRPAYPPVPLASLDLKAIRALNQARGDDFHDWLAGLRDHEAKVLVRRLDPHFPGVGKIDGTDALVRLAGLADGCVPIPDLDLGSLDAKSLRAARRRMGEHAFSIWSSAQSPGRIKAFAKRAAPTAKRPGKGAVADRTAALLDLTEPRKPAPGKPKGAKAGKAAVRRGKHAARKARKAG